jgi:hypothetical protein
MKRRLVIALSIAVILAGSLIGAATVYRRDLAQALIEGQLSSRGLAPATLTVTEVTPWRIEIADLSAGRRDEVRIEALVVHYRPVALLRGEVERVVLERPALQLDATGDGPVLGSLQLLVDRLALDDGGGDSTAAPPAPALVLRDARLEILTALGPATARLDGDVRPSGPGAWSIGLDWQASGPIGQADGRLEAALAPDQEVTGRLEIETASFGHPDLAASVEAVRGVLTFALTAGRLDAASAEIDLQRIIMPGRGAAQGSLSLSVDPTRLAATGRVATEDATSSEGLELAFDAAIQDYLGRPQVRLILEGSAGAKAPLWGFLPWPAPDGGRAVLNLNVSGALASPQPAAFDPDSLWVWLSGGSLTGSAEVEAQAMAFPDRIGALSGTLALEAGLAEGNASLRIRPGGILTAAGLSQAWLAELGAPPDVVQLLHSEVSIELPEAEVSPLRISVDLAESRPILDITLADPRLKLGPATASVAGRARLTLAPDWSLAGVEVTDLSIMARDLSLAGADLQEARIAGGLTGPIEDLQGHTELALRLGQVGLGTLAAKGLTLSATLGWRLFEDSLFVTLDQPGTVKAQGVSQAGVFSATGPLELSVVDGQGRLAPGGRLEHDVTLKPAGFGLAVVRGAGPPLLLNATVEKLRLEGQSTDRRPYEATARVTNAHLQLPDLGLSLDLPSTAIKLTTGGNDEPDRAEVRFDGVHLTQDGSPPLLHPLFLSGAIERRADALRLTGTVGPLGTETLIALTGRHNLDSEVGNLLIRAQPLDFAAGAPQPAALLPALTGLRFVQGRAEAEARLNWNKGDLESGGQINLREATLESGELTVVGLDLTLVLDDLLAPSSPPGQSLSFEHLDAGVLVENLDSSFRLLPDQKLQIERAAFRMLAGNFLVRDAIFDPRSAEQRIDLQVGDLELEKALETLQIEGLSGSGTVAGRIPLVVDGDKLVVERARLAATGPGVLRYVSANATAALQSGGESVDLMLQALEDFRYEELTLDADMDGEDQVSLLLSILGHNPQVLDGHPFRFNIALTSDLSPILQALRQGYELSDSLFRRTWNLGR